MASPARKAGGAVLEQAAGEVTNGSPPATSLPLGTVPSRLEAPVSRWPRGPSRHGVRHRTPASSAWPQFVFPQLEKLQWKRLSSVPLQATSSIQIRPKPANTWGQRRERRDQAETEQDICTWQQHPGTRGQCPASQPPTPCRAHGTTAPQRLPRRGESVGCCGHCSHPTDTDSPGPFCYTPLA